MRRIYKVYGGSTATTNAITYVTINSPGIIVGIYGSSHNNCSTDNGQATFELSFSSVNQVSTTDTIGSFFELRYWSNFVTSGLSDGGRNFSLDGPGISVQAGDRIYLHLVVSGTVDAYATFFIVVDQK